MIISMDECLIKVGIKTKGNPVWEKHEDLTLLKNMLIGDGFHWQQSIQALLPGNFDPSTLINTLPMETYLECVVGSEMNPDSPKEFLKAHAVISRSWALGKIFDLHHRGHDGKTESPDVLIGWDDTSAHNGFHVCSDDHCQRYQGLQPIPLTTLQAIRETAGEVLTNPDGDILDTRFSKCCGGQTEIFPTCWQSENVKCLESFRDPWCDLSGIPTGQRHSVLSSVLKNYDMVTEGYGFRWQSEISKKEIEKNLLDRFGRCVGRIKSIEPLHRGPSGRIRLLRIHGTDGYLDLGKELWIRRLLSPSHLYSSAFDIDDSGDSIRFRGKGWGHGVGLCQIGAANMALQGFDYKSILSFYYPGSVLSKFPLIGRKAD